MPAAMEIVREQGRACWLQMLVDDEPLGAALVLQPMLSRMVPITDIAPHPVSGQPHTRIIGWEVETDGPPRREGETGGDTVARTFSGLRIYPERDVRIETSLGDIVIALRPDEAPNTAWNFRHLAEGGFYKGVVFHRIVPTTRDGAGFVIQAGDPSASGEGGPGWWLGLEPSALEHDFGVISMARADHPDSAGSQFFIGLSRQGTARLDGQYCAFGHAVAGAETIRAIAAVELADVARGRPLEPPVIRSMTLVPAPPRRPGHGRPDTRVAIPGESVPARPARAPR
jgi:peptidyl-prolyl cis-trans isomerase B (cyclophilin B)